MKKVKMLSGLLALGMSSALVSSHADTSDNGAYLGVDLGMSFANLNDSGNASRSLRDIVGPGLSLDITSSTRSTNFSGRLYAGYMIIDNVGIEFGYSNYGTSHTNTNLNINDGKIGLESSAQLSAFDVLGVYRYEVYQGVSINAKAGLALVLNKYEVTGHVGDVSEKIDTFSNKNIRPKLGAGAEFAIADDLNIGVSYEVTFGNNKPYNTSGTGYEFEANGNKNYSPLIQMVTLGLRYEF